MSKIKISFGVFFGALNIAASGLSGILIYPLLLRNLSVEVAGLWLFFTSLSVIISLGQAGLAPIVMRRGAAVKMEGGTQVIAEYYELIKQSFKFVLLFVFAICLILFLFYVQKVLSENPTLYTQGLIAWCFFVIGNLINIYNSKNFYIINGFGEIGWDKVNQVFIVLFTLGGYYVVLNLGWGLIGLSSVFLVSSFFYAFISKHLLKKYISNEVFLLKTTVSKDKFISIFKDGGQIFILNIVGILVMNKDIFLVERFIGLDVLPAFSALNRIQGIIMSISLIIPQMIFPFIAQAYNEGDYFKSRNLYWKGVFFSISIGLVLSAIIFASADNLISIWLGQENYLGNQILGLLFCMGLLSIHHNAHASAVISTGGNSFVRPALINGLLSVPFSIIGIKYYGISGMIIGNLIATALPSYFVVSYSIRYFNKLIKNKNNYIKTEF